MAHFLIMLISEARKKYFRYSLIADPGGRCNLLVPTCNLLVGICNMLVDMLYNLLFNKHTFRVHKRDNDRYFAVLTIDSVSYTHLRAHET